MPTPALRIDLATTVKAEGTREEPVIEIADGDGRWAIRLVGSYDAVQRVCGEGLRLLFKLPDGTSPPPVGDGVPGIEEPYLRDDGMSSCC